MSLVLSPAATLMPEKEMAGGWLDWEINKDTDSGVTYHPRGKQNTR